MPTDRNRRPTEARRSGSSSMTRTADFASGIAATQIKGTEMGLCPGSQVWARACNLVSIPEPEQPHSSPEDTRGVDGSLRAPLTQLGGLLWYPACAILAPR